jgi:ankyrin repeat protein
MDIRTTIETGDVVALQELLAAVPGSANAPIRWGKSDEIVTHPLHFVCDKVFDGTLHSGRAVLLARALIEAGADIDHQDGDPLNAAASLGASEVGLLLLDAGARPDLRGLFGETALHWAATIGNAVLVQRLLEKGAPLDVKDDRWKATPISWALHGWGEHPPPGNHGHHREVVVYLVRAGAVVDPELLAEAQARGREDVVSALRGEL